jgi:hypothetical protein
MCIARSSTPAADTLSLIWLGGRLSTACEDMLKSYGPEGTCRAERQLVTA